jgi:hypothetical protein
MIQFVVRSREHRSLLLASTIVLCCSMANVSPGQQPVAAGSEPVTPGLATATRSAADPRNPADFWAPPDVDEKVPSVSPTGTCSLPEVLSGAAKRVKELVDDLQRFRATELVEHRGVNHSGRFLRPVTAKFDYLVFVSAMPDGLLDVEEHRQGYSSADESPDHVTTEGVPNLVFIFYPPYSKNFEMYCEGLGEWHGQPAWQVHFEEKEGGSSPMSVVTIGGRTFAVPLRGRAWILTDSYQVARLQTDIEHSVPKIRLRLEHEDIEYRPVYFHESEVEMWLPSTADLYMDFVGHRFYRRLTFTNFQLFSVTTHQVLGDPRRAQSVPKQK